MDHTHLLNQIRDRKNIERAYHYAINDRMNIDYYFDYFDLEFAFKNKDTIIDEIQKELLHPGKYIPRAAYAYFPPKTDLCYRRMIYISFKDLIIRYTVTIVLTEYLDAELSDNCFANRKASGDQAAKALLEDFVSESWPNFCSWQKDCAEEYSVLLRTDISAFYDSISHDYLVKLIAESLAIQEDTEIMLLLRKLLQIPVISYSNLTKEPGRPVENKQGLAIGNNTDGFLANLFLKDVDEVMSKIPNIEFGRYNDDMRIFGPDRKTVMESLLILQQYLLTKGLNLNSAKTRIAENREEIEDLRSKYYEVYFYHIEEVEAVEQVIVVNNQVAEEVDRPFDEFNRVFTPDDVIENNGDAKDYCKFLSTDRLLLIRERTPEFIQRVAEILKRWQGSGKHASWLLVQSSFWRGIPDDTKELSRRLVFEILEDNTVSPYSKYRILHHLIKVRGGKDKYRFLDQLTGEEKERLYEILPNLLAQPAFELNIGSLYTLKVLGASENELQEYVKKYIPKPIGDPIKMVLSVVREPIEIHEVPVIEEVEPDSRPEQY
jgi:hypothetical protein